MAERKTVMYNGQEVEVIDCTPTWNAAARIYLRGLIDGNAEGKAASMAGILEMADKLDRANTIIENAQGDGIDMSKYLPKDENPEQWEVLSPDGFTIEHTPNTYPSEDAARDAFRLWCKRYEQQGYYSSVEHGRIPLPVLEQYCEFNKIS